MSEEKAEVDSGEILKTLVKQGAFKAAKEYVEFLESDAAKKAASKVAPPVEVPEEAVISDIDLEIPEGHA